MSAPVRTFLKYGQPFTTWNPTTKGAGVTVATPPAVMYQPAVVTAATYIQPRKKKEDAEPRSPTAEEILAEMTVKPRRESKVRR